MRPLIGLVPFLKANGVAVDDSDLKVHLACWNGQEDPIDHFYADTFKEWQEYQTKRNFECAQVLSLINVAKDEWLFAGVYEITRRAVPNPKNKKHFHYVTKLLPGQDHLIGRIKVHHERTRASYVWHKPPVTLPIVEILRQRQVMYDFPGYNKVCITHTQLKTIHRQQIASWKSALASIKGVYLITDTSTGRHYVGKASGSDGIWNRWGAYADNGHGGNVELKALLKDKGSAHMANFQYTVLEIADTHATEDDILARESHWVNVLHSRKHGLNG
jgi:hypothetical protein